MPDLTRLGVRRRVRRPSRSACCLRGGTWPDCPPGAAAAWWPGWGRFPLIGEYVRLARGLGLVSYYDVVATS